MVEPVTKGFTHYVFVRVKDFIKRPIIIIKVFRTIVFIFIVISTTFSANMSSGLLQVFVELGNLRQLKTD